MYSKHTVSCIVLTLLQHHMHPVLSSLYCSTTCILYCPHFTAAPHASCIVLTLLQHHIHPVLSSLYCSTTCILYCPHFTAAPHASCIVLTLLQHHMHPVLSSLYCSTTCILYCPHFTAAPHASEPYLALATIYEDLGYDEKLLGILMIASHLKRSDCDMWMKTSNLAVKLKDLKIAIHCISKGVCVCVEGGGGVVHTGEWVWL